MPKEASDYTSTSCSSRTEPIKKAMIEDITEKKEDFSSSTESDFVLVNKEDLEKGNEVEESSENKTESHNFLIHTRHSWTWNWRGIEWKP